MTFEEIIQKAKIGDISPIYFLHGDEPYFIDKIAETVQKHALTEEERGFNEIILYGKDINSLNLKHTAMQFPMGAKRQLIIVREAQNMTELDALTSYFTNPLLSTVLVILYKYKKFDGRTKVYQALSKQAKAVVFESKKLYDNKMEQWIAGLIKEKGLTIEPRASALLTEYLGTDLELVVQSIDKLTIAMGPGKTKITVDDVVNNIGINKEYNTFELQAALISRDVLKANRIVNAFAANPNDYPIQMVISTLFAFFSKLLLYYYIPNKTQSAIAEALKINPYFVKDYTKAAQNYKGIKVFEIISLLREFDMKSKGFGNVSASSGDLLKELTFRILH
jgi:DNA polymerase-3 subunit delta